LIDDAQPVASAVAGSHGADLDQLVASMTKTLAAVSEQREQTTATLRQMPETLVQARATLARLSGVADPTTEVLSSIRPVTGQLTDISAELKRFSDAADPALASLAPVLDRGKLMLDEARPLVRDLRPGGASLRDVARSGHQLADTVLGDHLTQVMEFMKGWALATSDYDAISHYFKAIVPVSPAPLGKTAGGLVPGLPDDPLADTLAGLSNLLPGLLGPAKAPSSSSQKAPDKNSATGLTPKQENSLLSQLLGGK
jgi:phospholipid/cholesterol/gamma-HCH transport system substrate-binding protein